MLIQKLIEREFTIEIDEINIAKISPKLNESMQKVEILLNDLRKEGGGDFVYWEDDIDKKGNKINNFILKTLNKFNDIMFNNDIKKNSASGLNNYSCILLLSKLLEKTNMNENKKITIIIDEPEKFCHPNLLNKLIENLIVISQKVNLYISSHSPYLISKIYSTNNKPELLFFHEKYSNKPTENIKRIDKNVFEDVNNNVFRSVLVKNEIYRREFIYNLFANKIIIVEDNSTKIFVQYLLEKNNIHDNINIYVCHGKSWMNKTYNYLIDKFFINKEKIYCIYDEDSNKQPHEQHNENHNKIPENKKWGFNKCLEDDLDIIANDNDKYLSEKLLDFISKNPTNEKFKELDEWIEEKFGGLK